jgi:hypothetical protein
VLDTLTPTTGRYCQAHAVRGVDLIRGFLCSTPPPLALPFLRMKMAQRTRRPRLTPSPCSRTGFDALVGILVVDKEEPSSKRGHGDACASAGG